MAPPLSHRPRAVVGGVALLASAALLVGCSSGPSTPDGTASAPAASPSAAPSGTPANPTSDAWGAATADELIAVLAAARSVADGTVTDVEADRDGTWDVAIELSPTEEVDVRVATDGTATVTERDDDSDDADRYAGSLDDAGVRTVVGAALSGRDGRVTAISLEDDDDTAYSVDVRLADGTGLDLDLDAAGAIRSEDTDN